MVLILLDYILVIYIYLKKYLLLEFLQVDTFINEKQTFFL